MIGIDQIAYCSPLKDMHPVEKMVLAISTLLLVISMDSYLLSVLVLSLMSYLLLVKARVEGRFFLKIMAIPMGFLLMGCLTVAISLGNHLTDYIYCLNWGAIQLGVTADSLSQAGHLLVKSLAAVSCLYFLALTTPITQLIYILRRLKMPPVLIDLVTIIYSNIFMLLRTVEEIYVAQLSRGGYRGFMGSMKSLALLCSNLLMKSLKASEDAYNCLVSRGFAGHFRVVEEAYYFKALNMGAILGFDVLLFLLHYSGRY